MTVSHVVTLELQFEQTDVDDSEPVAFFLSTDDGGKTALTLDWDRYVEIGRPEAVTVSVTDGRCAVGRSYTSV